MGTKFHPQLYHTRINGMLDYFTKRNFPLTFILPFVIPIMNGTVSNLYLAIILENSIRSYQLFCHTHAGNDRFKYRTRFVNHGDGLITPSFRTIIAILIRIKSRSTGHTKNFSGIRIHNNCCSTLRFGALNGIFHSIFQNVLHFAIQGQINTKKILLLLSLGIFI